MGTALNRSVHKVLKLLQMELRKKEESLLFLLSDSRKVLSMTTVQSLTKHWKTLLTRVGIEFQFR